VTGPLATLVRFLERHGEVEQFLPLKPTKPPLFLRKPIYRNFRSRRNARVSESVARRVRSPLTRCQDWPRARCAAAAAPTAWQLWTTAGPPAAYQLPEN